MTQQVEIILKERTRGFHLITREIAEQLPALPRIGLLNLFVKHTSCALSINENADLRKQLEEQQKAQKKR